MWTFSKQRFLQRLFRNNVVSAREPSSEALAQSSRIWWMPFTSPILHDIESLGYFVSIHRIPSSLLGTVGAFTEMHAVLLAEPNDQHIAKVDAPHVNRPDQNSFQSR